MRHPIFLVILLATLAGGSVAQTPVVITGPVTITGRQGPQGPAGPPGPPGRDGAPGSGVAPSVIPDLGLGKGEDDSAILQRLIDNYEHKSHHTNRLPAGDLIFNRPVMVWRENIRFLGVGVGETNIRIDPGLDAFVIGQVDPSGFDDSGRPDLFGLLDDSVSPSPGVARGFDTQGRNFIVEKGGGLQNGGFSNGAWDYWESTKGVTVSFALGGPIPTGKPLFGIGGYQAGASPWYVTTGFPGELWFCFRLKGDGGANRALVIPGFDFGGGRKVNRCQVWIDFETGDFGAYSNGIRVTPTFKDEVIDLKGKSLLINDRDQRFSVGGGLEVKATPFQLLALSVSNIPLKTWGGNDQARFLNVGPGVVGGMDVKRKDPGRLVRFSGGGASTKDGSYGVVFASPAVGQSVSGTVIRDLSIHNGGVALAGVLDTDLIDLDCQGGRTGLDAFPVFANYRLRTRNLVLGGDTAACKLYSTLGTMDSPRFTTGGLTSVYSTTNSIIWNQAIFAGFGPKQRRAVDLVGGGYGGHEVWIKPNIAIPKDRNDVWIMPTVDGEGLFFTDEVFRVEQTNGCLRGLRVIDGAAAGLAPTGVVFRLWGVPVGTPGCYPALIEVSGFGMPPCSSVAEITGGVGQWVGSIDLRQSPYLSGPVGPAFDPVRLGVAK